MRSVAILLCLALTGCNAAATVLQQPVTVPFELYENTPFVEVRVNGTGPLWFLIDSGADTCLIDRRHAASLGLNVRGQSSTTGFGDGATSISFARGVVLSLGAIELPRQTVVVYQFSELEPILGRRIDGIIGRNLFERFVVEFDYIRKSMTIYEPKSYTYSGSGVKLPLTFDDDLPMVPGAVMPNERSPGLPGKFLIDTGANDQLDLNTGFVNKHRILDAVSRTVPASAFGANGESKGRSGRIFALKLGSFRVDNPISGLSQATNGVEADPDREGRIGGGILSRFHLAFDYSRKVLFIEPNERLADSFETDMTGLRLTAGGAEFNIFTVREVRPDSASDGAGFRAGDVILEIDGAPAGRFSLAQIREMFKRDGNTYSIIIDRAGTRMPLSLRTSRIL
jgi:Aspartyl protease/PDZ domain